MLSSRRDYMQYFTTEPEYIKAILATKFDSFEKGDYGKAHNVPSLSVKTLILQARNSMNKCETFWEREYSTQTVRCGSQSLKALMSS